MSETQRTQTVATRPAVEIGVNLRSVTDIETAITTAGLDWGLTIRPATDLTIFDEDGLTSTSIPGMRLVMRDDNNVTLGVVGGKYATVDNRSVFSMGQHVLEQGGKLVSGGALDYGRKVFMKFALPDAEIKVAGVDLVTFGVTIRASHDGSGNVFAGVEATRLACTNGMTTKIKGVPNEFKLRHTASAETRMVEARAVLQGAVRYAKEFVAAADVMFDTKMTLGAFKNYINAIWPHPTGDEANGRAATLWATRQSELVQLFKFAETNKIGRGTEWAAYNAVTEYLDWAAPVRATAGRTSDEARARRQFDNSNQAVKDEAFALLH